MDYRSGKQCRERYINQLDPLIKKTEWTVEEDEIIKRLHGEIGKKWRRYMDQLPGRSDNAIKNRYHVISKDNYTDHNLHHAAFLSGSLPEHSTGQFVPETEAVCLDRFRSARELLDRKIKALERERDILVEQALDAMSEEASGSRMSGTDSHGERKQGQSCKNTSEAVVVEPDDELVSAVSSITTAVSAPVPAKTPDVVVKDEAEEPLQDFDSHTYSTVLDDLHFDGEDMCYNDPHVSVGSHSGSHEQMHT